MTLRTKLCAGFAGVFVPMAALFLLAVGALGTTNQNTTRLYRERLAPTIAMSQVVENLDQMRQLVAQYVLTPRPQDTKIRSGAGIGESLKVLHVGVMIEIGTLDQAIAQGVAEYGGLTHDRDQRAFLAQWPGAWRSFVAMRSRLLHESLASRQGHAAAISALTTLFNDRLNTLLDLSYRLMGAQQAHGYTLYQSSEETYTYTLVGLIAGLIVVALLSILFAVAIARSVVGPVQAVTRAARRLAAGDTAVDGELPPPSRDEIGALAASFRAMVAHQQDVAAVAGAVAAGDLTQTVTPQGDADTLGRAFAGMLGSLRALIGHVSGTASQVAAGAGQVAQTVEQISQASTHIAGAIGEVANGTQQQAAVVGQAEQAIREMRASLTRTMENAGAVADAAARASTSAREGDTAMQQTIASIESARAAVDQSAARVHALGQRSDEIGQIVATIDDIAAQTNLLALNAAIEAARAGEHGKGFAVVAAEVRKLAERAGNETKAITARITAMQQQVGGVVAAMETGTQEVQSSVALGHQAQEALQRIHGVVDETNAQAQAITEAVAEMSSRVEIVSGAAQQVAAVATQTAAGAQEVSASTEQQSAGAQEMAAGAQELSALASALQEAVQRFTLPPEGVEAADPTAGAVVPRRRAADWAQRIAL